jgi:LmbE family N-acetylglucosaminyl deacetylase
VREHHWLDHRDGECAAADADAAVARLCAVLDDVRPDTVLTFGPDGITGHPDHRTVSAWAGAAVDRAAPGVRLLHSAVTEQRAVRWSALTDRLGVYLPGYPVLTPAERLAVGLVLPRDIAVRKVRALAAQATQTAGLIATLGVDPYRAWVGEEEFVEAAPVPVTPSRTLVGSPPS